MNKNIASDFKKGQNTHWGTPPELFEELDEEFSFDYEPCKAFSEVNDLETEWGKVNFVNPPYNKIKFFVKKALEEKKLGKTSVFLIPGRTNSNYFHDLIYPNAKEIRFVRGKVKFHNLSTGEPNIHGAPFPCLIIVF